MFDADSNLASPARTPEAVVLSDPAERLPSSEIDHKDVVEGEEAASSANDIEEKGEAAFEKSADNVDDDDEEELLSDVDEDQFEDYDPATAQIEERPITIDEEAARGLKSAKRKRTAGDEISTARKPNQGRREKKRRPGAGATGTDADADAAGGSGEGAVGKRARRGRPAGDTSQATRRRKSQSPAVNEEDLTPEERRKRALNRAIDLAIRNPNKRRRKQDEDDLEQMADEEIAQLKIQMEQACMLDVDARAEGRPAVNKLQLLPQVLSVLNRNDIQETVLDPETNFLQSVKFFLEPLNDGSLPSYTIQRDIFTCLTRLPIEKDALLSSGIGKVVLFYTRSKRAEPAIKRMAERLVGDWSRPILKKTDDFRKRHIETRDYDYRAAKRAEAAAAAVGVDIDTMVAASQGSFGGMTGSGSSSQYTLTERPLSRFELDKEIQLAPPVVNPNRAQPVGPPQSYTIAPKSMFEGHRSADFRPIGASSMEAFRRMTQKSKMRGKKK